MWLAIMSGPLAPGAILSVCKTRWHTFYQETLSLHHMMGSTSFKDYSTLLLLLTPCTFIDHMYYIYIHRTVHASVHPLYTCMFGYVAHHMSNGSFYIVIILFIQYFLKAFRRMLCRFWNPCLTMVSMEMHLGKDGDSESFHLKIGIL